LLGLVQGATLIHVNPGLDESTPPLTATYLTLVVGIIKVSANEGAENTPPNRIRAAGTTRERERYDNFIGNLLHNFGETALPDEDSGTQNLKI
jgi:hypothetical protein